MATETLKLTTCGHFPITSTESLQQKLVHLLESIVLPAKTVSALNTATIFNTRDQMEGSTDFFILTIIMISWTVMLISLLIQSAKPSALLTHLLPSSHVILSAVALPAVPIGIWNSRDWTNRRSYHLVNVIDSGSVLRPKNSQNNVAAMVTVVTIFFGQEMSPILSLAKKIITHTIMKMNIWTRMEHII